MKKIFLCVKTKYICNTVSELNSVFHVGYGYM